MKKFYLILAAVTGLTLVGCTSDDLVVDQMANAYPTEDQPIMFSSLNKGMTRADFVGKEAADKLGNQFVVFGYKGATTGTPGSTVFDNYTVKYYENTAGTSASNSNDWE